MKINIVSFVVTGFALVSLTACTTTKITYRNSDKVQITAEQFADEARHIVGKKFRGSITFRKYNGETLGPKQFHGTITSVGEDGLKLQLEGNDRGHTFTLPHDIPGVRVNRANHPYAEIDR